MSSAVMKEFEPNGRVKGPGRWLGGQVGELGGQIVLTQAQRPSHFIVGAILWRSQAAC